jgi:hypothetical protein
VIDREDVDVGSADHGSRSSTEIRNAASCALAFTVLLIPAAPFALVHNRVGEPQLREPARAPAEPRSDDRATESLRTLVIVEVTEIDA